MTASPNTHIVVGDVSTSVRDLLVSTKLLSDALELWAFSQLRDIDVSDAYVQLGSDFNKVTRDLRVYKIDMSDLYHIPKQLRSVLEQCLAENPSTERLAVFMPSINQLIAALLVGLQSKQRPWRRAQKQNRVQRSAAF